MRTAVVVPSLGGPHLEVCLRSVAALEPHPGKVIVVMSGGSAAPPVPADTELRLSTRRLGFTAAVNTGLTALTEDIDAVAVLNDDAVPDPGWLGVLTAALERRPELAAVQGTVVTADRSAIDGRGIEFDRWRLPVQVDRGRPFSADDGERPVIAVSGTACIFRMQALRQISFADGTVFDESFDSYHEDLDVGLRLMRLGWRAAWTGGAVSRHLGSASGTTFSWRHPWWLMANRWRALAGNLSPGALLHDLPRLLRGELRAIRTLARSNPRATVAAAAAELSAPLLVAGGWLRSTPGERLRVFPEALS